MIINYIIFLLKNQIFVQEDFKHTQNVLKIIFKTFETERDAFSEPRLAIKHSASKSKKKTNALGKKAMAKKVHIEKLPCGKRNRIKWKFKAADKKLYSFFRFVKKDYGAPFERARARPP